jgi:hypothetical protein
MEAKNVNIRDLQQLNDAIAYTMDAIQRISPQVTGLGHSPYGQIPFAVGPYAGGPGVVDPFGAIRSSLEQAAFASRAVGNPLFAQGPYGIQGLGGLGLAHSPYGTPALTNPLLAAQLGALGSPYAAYGGLPFPGVRVW